MTAPFTPRPSAPPLLPHVTRFVEAVRVARTMPSPEAAVCALNIALTAWDRDEGFRLRTGTLPEDNPPEAA